MAHALNRHMRYKINPSDTTGLVFDTPLNEFWFCYWYVPL